ncbi:MAG: DNA translocase FtsK 4TM domain-containing protein, partial [Planctomycetota bacterium]
MPPGKNPGKSAGTKTGKKSAEELPVDPPAWAALLWCLAAAATLLLGAALVSFDPLDPPNPAVGVANQPVQNWVGTVGARLAFETQLMLGPGVWVVLASVVWVLGWTAARRPVGQPELRALGVTMIALAVATGYGVFVRRYGDLSAANPWGPGGLVGGWASDQLGSRFGVLGAGVILAGTAYCGLVLAADRVALAAPRVMGEAVLRVLDISKTTAPKLQLAGRATTAWERLRAVRVQAWQGAETDLDDAPGADELEDQPSRRKRRGRKAKAEAEETETASRSSRKSRRKAKPEPEVEEEDAWEEEAEAESDDDGEWEYEYEYEEEDA